MHSEDKLGGLRGGERVELKEPSARWGREWVGGGAEGVRGLRGVEGGVEGG